MKNIGIPKAVMTEIEKLMSLSESYIDSTLGAHEIEKGLLSQLLEIGLNLLNHIVDEKLAFLSSSELDLDRSIKFKSSGPKERKYLSLFGELTILRPTMLTSLDGNMFLLDELLQLPTGTKLSYNLQNLLGENASESDFKESVRVLNKLLNLNLSNKTSERNGNRLGAYVDDFYNQQEVQKEESAVCFSASFDGKGVPKIKAAKVSGGNPKKRLGKGEKRGIMQMATVSVTGSFTPKERSVEGIIHSLMGSGLSKVEKDDQAKIPNAENDNRWHQDITRRAFLGDQEKAIEYGIEDIKKRMKNPNSRLVVPIDAGIGLEDKVIASIKKHGLEDQFDGIILDIIHVSEYVWDSATAIFGEKSALRAQWVRESLTDILNSRTDVVINQLIKNRDKTKLSDNKIKALNKTITYFTNHKHKMDYKKFIDKGYPVSSALVESACGHLVKERMEQSGMRWSSKGAQSIMDLRSVKLNEDMDKFIQFVTQKERKLIFNIAA